LPILQQVVILDQVFIVKFAVIVVAVYVASSLVNRDDPKIIRTRKHSSSALEVFLNDMRYINPRFTYLLTYLLTSRVSHSGMIRPAPACATLYQISTEKQRQL